MMRYATPQRASQQGFTLIETIFAVLTLAGSLIILLGLQTSATARSVDDGSRQQAMLAARTILTALELRTEPLPTGQQSGSVREILDRTLQGIALTKDGSDTRKEDAQGALQLRADLNVEAWGFPVPGSQITLPDVMRRVTLIIRWADTPRAQYEITYFLPIGIQTDPADPDQDSDQNPDSNPEQDPADEP